MPARAFSGAMPPCDSHFPEIIAQAAKRLSPLSPSHQVISKPPSDYPNRQAASSATLDKKEKKV
jgi:hypothetical protein